MTSHRWFILPALAGIVVASVFLVRSADDASVYYMYTSEAVAHKADFGGGRRFRMAGSVVPGSIEQGKGESWFQIDDGLATVDIHLVAVPPPLFDENVEVLLEGAWDGDVFTADQALIRHEGNYQAPATGNAPETANG